MIVTCFVDNQEVDCDTWESDHRKEVLSMLKRDAHKLGEYTLSSGRQSKHYVNCKPVTLSGHGIALLGDLFLQYIDEDAVAVAGLTLGGDPLVSGVSLSAWYSERKLDALIVRKEPKGHGTAAWVEGPLPPLGSKITVLEDVITTGKSAIKAVEALRNIGYVVDRIVAIVDRQVDGEADINMCAAHVELYTLFQLNDIVYGKDN